MIDFVWQEKKRDWSWLGLRHKTVTRQQPITPHDMSKLTLLKPHDPYFALLLEAERKRQ